jgi:GH15 family glucan-1,4-alpha-glucosidase
MWPRDGALVSWALDRCGYHDLTRRFFEFCAKTLPEDRAAWLHKYSSDGSWGSTWHPWVIDGEVEIPFQEDSTALVLWALDNHIRMTGDLEFLRSVYDSMVSPCADFISSFRDTMTGLPLPSYDLWEERRGTHAYTCGTVYGALLAAASMADALSDNKAVRYRIAAEEVRQGIVTHLWDAQANRFARRLVPKDGGYERDMTLDCALYGLFAFGALRAEDPMVETTMRAVVSRLWVQTDVGGMARYEGDYYFRRSGDLERIPGNPWFICTLWAAQWYIARAKSKAEMTTALDLMHWAARRGMETGILPEQLHPESGEPISVAPLTWSHAEFVSTCLNYKERVKELYG